MSKVSYIPSTDTEKGIWLENFANQLALRASLLGISSDEIASLVADSAVLTYMLDIVEWFKRGNNEMMNYKNQLINGTIESNFIPIPDVGAIPEAPDSVPAGIFKRVSKLVERIQQHPAYTQSLGEYLGIETYAAPKPELKLTVEEDRPVIWWNFGCYVAADIYVDRNEGNGFVFLATATESRYTDTYELPKGVRVAIWQYKAIYKDGNKQIGEFSDIVIITAR